MNRYIDETDDYIDETDRLEKKFGTDTLGEMEDKLNINNYNNEGVGNFGLIITSKLPATREEAMKIFDMTEINKSLGV